jgi:hypothetical protein
LLNLQIETVKRKLEKARKAQFGLSLTLCRWEHQLEISKDRSDQPTVAVVQKVLPQTNDQGNSEIPLRILKSTANQNNLNDLKSF